MQGLRDGDEGREGRIMERRYTGMREKGGEGSDRGELGGGVKEIIGERDGGRWN